MTPERIAELRQVFGEHDLRAKVVSECLDEVERLRGGLMAIALDGKASTTREDMQTYAKQILLE